MADKGRCRRRCGQRQEAPPALGGPWDFPCSELRFSSRAWVSLLPRYKALGLTTALLLLFSREEPRRFQNLLCSRGTVRPGQSLLQASSGGMCLHPSAREHQQHLVACVEATAAPLSLGALGARPSAEPCDLCHHPAHWAWCSPRCPQGLGLPSLLPAHPAPSPMPHPSHPVFPSVALVLIESRDGLSRSSSLSEALPRGTCRWWGTTGFPPASQNRMRSRDRRSRSGNTKGALQRCSPEVLCRTSSPRGSCHRWLLLWDHNPGPPPGSPTERPLQGPLRLGST